MEKKILYFLMILFCNYGNIWSQNKIDGIVVDSINIPIPYATVYFENAKVGTISNEDGKFTMEKSEKREAKLMVSCLGYKPVNIDISTFNEKAIKIILKPAIINLNEIIVKPVDAEKTIKKAIKNFPINYPSKSIKINGIYKQITMINDEYNGLFTCNVNIYLNGMLKRILPKYRPEIIDYELYKKNNNVYFIKPSANIVDFFLYEYPFIKNTSDYKYLFDSKIEFENMILLKINFEPQKLKEKEKQYKGYIYIDEKTYAIIYIDYNLIPNKSDFKEIYKIKQKAEFSSIKTMFTKSNSFFHIKYIITKSTSKIIRDGKTLEFSALFNFFSTEITYTQDNLSGKILTFDEIISKNKGKTFDKSKNYNNEFILETSNEKKIKKHYGE